MNPFISLCMIVKDEERVLRRCLDSVKGIVEEIVIVDTGSTDNTREIVKEFTDKLYDYQWKNDFSDARNFAASKATGQWIFVLDADEYVEQENLLRAIEEIREHHGTYDMYAVNIINFAGHNGESTAQHMHGRIYKNDGTVEFHRAIHEQLRKKSGQISVGISSVVIYHTGYLSKTVMDKNKNDRNVPLIENELKKSSSPGFDYFNLGNELKREKKTEEALQAFVKAYQNKSSFTYSWVPYCLCNIVECLIELDRNDDALNVIEDAERLFSNMADFTYLKGGIYMLQKRYDDAKAVFTKILSNIDTYTEVVKSPDYKEYQPNKNLGLIYEAEKDYVNAVKYYMGALNVNHYCFESTIKLIDILSKLHLEKDIFNLLSNDVLGKNDKEFHKKIIIHALNRGLSEYATLHANYYLGDDSLLLEIIEIKNNIIQGTLEKYNNDEGTDASKLLTGLSIGILDSVDLIIMEQSLENSIGKRRLQVILYSIPQIKAIVEMIVEGNSTEEIDAESYLFLLEKCILFKQFELIDRLLPIADHAKVNLYGKVAEIFYRNGFEDIAIDLYEQADIEQLAEQDFVNLIEWLIAKGNGPEAHRISMEALTRFYKDFRFYRYAILINQNNREFVGELAKKGFSIFKDSNWLRTMAPFVHI